jgi:hypothetical protein
VKSVKKGNVHTFASPNRKKSLHKRARGARFRVNETAISPKNVQHHWHAHVIRSDDDEYAYARRSGRSEEPYRANMPPVPPPGPHGPQRTSHHDANRSPRPDAPDFLPTHGQRSSQQVCVGVGGGRQKVYNLPACLPACLSRPGRVTELLPRGAPSYIPVNPPHRTQGPAAQLQQQHYQQQQQPQYSSPQLLQQQEQERYYQQQQQQQMLQEHHQHAHEHEQQGRNRGTSGTVGYQAPSQGRSSDSSLQHHRWHAPTGSLHSSRGPVGESSGQQQQAPQSDPPGPPQQPYHGRYGHGSPCPVAEARERQQAQAQQPQQSPHHGPPGRPLSPGQVRGSGSAKEPAYRTLLRTPYVKISKALYDPYRRVGSAEPLVRVGMGPLLRL